MKNHTKIFFAVAVTLATLSATGQTLPRQNNKPFIPDEWLFAPGQPWFHKVPANGTGRQLQHRQPTAGEQRAIDDIQKRFADLPSKAFLLGDGDKIVKIEYKSPANDNSTFLSASVDKTVTAMSAGVAVCDGKIKLSTKAKEVLPELTGTAIGEATLRDALMMASGTSSALDDSQSLTKENLADLISGNTSFMALLKGRWGQQQGWQKPGEKFSYKSQDPTLVGMMISAAYGTNGKNFRQWQTDNFFPKVQTNDRRFQGQDRFDYAWAEGNTRMTIRDWARFAVFVQESRKQNNCYGNFVRDATSTQIKTDRRFAVQYGGYGYQTWTDNSDIPNSYSALGYGGQAIIWSTTSDKYFVIFSNNNNPPDIHPLARAWLESK
jgi:CubicO group peptidase (beta-lactamase class C family)